MISIFFYILVLIIKQYIIKKQSQWVISKSSNNSIPNSNCKETQPFVFIMPIDALDV